LYTPAYWTKSLTRYFVHYSEITPRAGGVAQVLKCLPGKKSLQRAGNYNATCIQLIFTEHQVSELFMLPSESITGEQNINNKLDLQLNYLLSILSERKKVDRQLKILSPIGGSSSCSYSQFKLFLSLPHSLFVALTC
jgi:hypothetical protein